MVKPPSLKCIEIRYVQDFIRFTDTFLYYSLLFSDRVRSISPSNSWLLISSVCSLLNGFCLHFKRREEMMNETSKPTSSIYCFFFNVIHCWPTSGLDCNTTSAALLEVSCKSRFWSLLEGKVFIFVIIASANLPFHNPNIEFVLLTLASKNK